MQSTEETKEKVMQFLEWIEEDPTQWEEVLGQRSVDLITPMKTMDEYMLKSMLILAWCRYLSRPRSNGSSKIFWLI